MSIMIELRDGSCIVISWNCSSSRMLRVLLCSSVAGQTITSRVTLLSRASTKCSLMHLPPGSHGGSCCLEALGSPVWMYGVYRTLSDFTKNDTASEFDLAYFHQQNPVPQHRNKPCFSGLLHPE